MRATKSSIDAATESGEGAMISPIGDLAMEAFDAPSVAEHFQLGRPNGALQFVARGQKNALGLCRLQTDSGCYAVKRFEERPRAAALAIETAAFEAGLPLPRPMRAGDGQFIASYQSGVQTIWVRVFSWVAGAPLDWGCAVPEISVEVGKLMASIHDLPVPEEILCEDRSPQWSALTEGGWVELAERAEARHLPWAEALRVDIPQLVDQETYLAKSNEKKERAVPSQRDLHPPNVVRSPSSGLFLVDWDSAGPVVAREDVAKYALVWATPDWGEPLRAAVHAFIDGYRMGGGEYRSQGPNDLLYRQETLHWWLLFNIRRDLSPRPGPDPELTPALLNRAAAWEATDLEPLAALLDY